MIKTVLSIAQPDSERPLIGCFVLDFFVVWVNVYKLLADRFNGVN